MLEGFFWMVVGYKFPDGKLFAHAKQVARYHNFLEYLRHPNIITVNVCKTKKDALCLAQAWNDAYRQNGTLAE